MFLMLQMQIYTYIFIYINLRSQIPFICITEHKKIDYVIEHYA